MADLERFLRLIEDAQQRQSFGDVDFLLGPVLTTSRLDGVVLWLPWRERFPRTNEDDPASETVVHAAGSLFRARAGERIFHTLKATSVTGHAIDKQQPWRDVFTGDRLVARDIDASERNIIQHFGITAAAGVPFSVCAGGRSVREETWRTSFSGALNFYRCGSRNNICEIDDRELMLLKVITRLFTFTFTSMVDAVGLRFIAELKGILADVSQAQIITADTFLDTLRPTCAKVEDLISRVIPCREVCIHLLREDVPREAVYCPAGIWPWAPERAQVREFERGHGITGGCLQEGKTLVLGNVVQLSERARYACVPPFSKEDALSAGIERDINGDIAPVSVLAIPLIDRQRTVGVLRCAAKSNSPYLFGPHEIFFLEQAAALMGDWFGRKIALMREKRARQSTLAIFTALGRLGSVESATTEQSFPRIEEFVDCWTSALPSGSKITFRLASRDPESGQLLFKRIFSRPHTEGVRRVVSAPGSFSWGQYRRDLESCYHSQGVYLPWPKAPWVADSPSSQLIVFPLFDQPTEPSRVFEVTLGQNTVLSEQDRHLSFLFSKLIGVAEDLIRHVQAETKAKREQRDAKEAEEKSFKLLAHQVKTPLSTALGAIERLVERTRHRTPQLDKIQHSAHEAARAVDRAWRVAQRMRVFTDLAVEGQLSRVERTPVYIEQLYDRLAEMAADHEREHGSKRGIRLAVSGVKEKLLTPLFVDLDLIEQAAEVLVENAVKYGDERSTVDIALVIASHGRRLLIHVRNSGRNIPLRADEVRRAKEFGVRLDPAVSTRRTGWGAGLYLAKEIMKAHGGHLEIVPTTERDRITTFTLNMPIGPEL